MSTIVLSEDRVKELFKQALVELLQERRDLLQGIVAEALDRDKLKREIEDTKAQLSDLNDEALWRSARMTMPKTALKRYERLNSKKQREGLTRSEAEEADLLRQRYERVIFIRAHSAALLKQRGHDVNVLLNDQ